MVAGPQERRNFIDTQRNDISVKLNDLENTRNIQVRLGKLVRELRIRRLEVRIPSRAPPAPEGIYFLKCRKEYLTDLKIEKH